MKIAMLLKYEKEEGVFDDNILYVISFEVIDMKILSVDQEYLYNKNINYISLWLLERKINEIYTSHVDKKTKDYFTKIGILLKSYEELENKQLYEKYLE